MAVKDYKIKKVQVDDAETLKIDTVLWDSGDGAPDTYAQIAYDDEGFEIKYRIEESNPLAEQTVHCQPVHTDSCVEFFVNFLPDETDWYINFEVNANGIMNPSYRLDRYQAEHLTLEEIEGLDIKTDINEDYWTVSFKMSYEFIRHYYKGFDINKCNYIIGNLQKCGEKTNVKHFLSYFPIECEKPDFHRPEYFGTFTVEH